MQRIRLAVRQVGAGVEQEADRARRLACIQNVRPIRIRDAERLASHNGSTALLEQIGLLRRKLHPHATAAARGQDRPAGDGDRAIGVQGLVVRCVGGPDSDLAAGDCHGAVGIQTIAAGAEGRDVATGNGDLKGSVLQLGIGGIDAVIRRGDLQITAADDDLRRFDTLIAAGDADSWAVRVCRADGERAIAVQRIIGGSECQISALDRQGLLSVESIAELGRDLQGQSADSQADILLVCRAAGGDAVLAEGCDGQRPAAAQHNLAACLAFEHGIFRICILRRGIVTV